MLILLAVALIVIPALTYYATTALFFQTSKDVATGKTPPTIPYLVPGVFHTFSIAFEGAPKFFARLLNEYGGFAPFTVKVGLKSFVVLRDPEHVRRAAKASEVSFQSSTTRREEKKPISSLVGADGEKTSSLHGLPIDKYLTGASLTNICELYASKLSSNMNDKMFQTNSWTQIEDFWSFFQQVLTRCSIETLFGSAIFRQYSGLTKDYWKYQDAAEGHSLHLPYPLEPREHEEHLEKLLAGVEKWFKTNHSGSEFAQVGSEDPDWDEHKGSKFIQESDDGIARVSNDRERAMALFKIMQSSNENLVPSAIWAMIEILRKPELAEHFTNTVSKQGSTQTSGYNVENIAALPLVKSLQREISRLRIAREMTYHCNRQNVPLDTHYTLPAGSIGIAFSRDIALDAKSWAKARPRTVERPLSTFWAERFLIPGGKQKPRSLVETGEFSLDGLEVLEPAFGGHQDTLLSNGYLEAMQTATLAVLLREWEIQLCDPEAADEAVTVVSEKAFGAVRPLERIAVRIRKRRTGARA